MISGQPTTALAVLACAALASAHGAGHHHRHNFMPRATTTATVSQTTTPAGAASQTTAPASSTTPQTQIPGIASASDAVPLSKIVPIAVQPSDSVTYTYATPTPGTIPSGLPKAPGLPDISNWATMQAGYPSADPTVPLDLNNALVKGWIQDVANSGVTIPNIQPRAYTNEGNNCELPESLARKATWDSEGWWTCGHTTRSTDITECTTDKTWGSSFDDGPSDSTPAVLDWFATNNLKTTFFNVGTAIYWRPWVLQAAYTAGHQVAVHTWNHHALTNLTNEQVIAELGWTKKIMKDVLGVTPLYMRPPYGDIDDRVRAICKAMNLTPVMWTVTGTEQAPVPFDTFDWEVPGGDATPAQSVTQFNNLLNQADSNNKGFIVLSHDLYWEEKDLSLGYFLPMAQSRKYNIVPVHTCAGQDLVNAYAETATSSSLPSGSSGGNSTTTSSGAGSTSTGGGSGGALPLMDSVRVAMALGLASVFAILGAL